MRANKPAQTPEGVFTDMTDIDNNINLGESGETAEFDAVSSETNEKAKKPTALRTAWTRIRKSRITVLIFSILLAIAPLVATRLAALATESGKPRSHYLTDSANYTSFIVLLICTLIFSLLPLIFIDRRKFGKEHLVPRILNLIPALGAAIAAYLFFYFSTANVFEGESKWALYISLCGCVAAMFFLLKTVGNSKFTNVMAGLRVLTAIGVFAFSALVIISLYLDYNTELNSHFKLSVQFASVGVMLGTMADVRSILGSVTKRRYLSFKAIALTLTSTGAASVFVRASEEITAFKADQGIANLSIHDLVTHFQSHPSAAASYVICSLFFVTYAASVAAEIIFTSFTPNDNQAV